MNPSPFKHPEKSMIFLGTRFIPLPFVKGRGKRIFLKGLFTPQKLNFCGDPVFAPFNPPAVFGDFACEH